MFASFSLDLRPEWGSFCFDHRMGIRKAIAEGYPQSDFESILNLDQRPDIPGVFVSISHCHYLGGFVAWDRRVGLDCVDPSRLSLGVIERISVVLERNLLSDIRWLWPLKEACFKVEGVGILSDFSLKSWDEFEQKGILASGQKVYEVFCLRKQGHLVTVAAEIPSSK